MHSTPTDRRIVRARAGEPWRDEMEAQIRAAFFRRHGARVEQFMPELVGLLGNGSTLLGSIGLRSAASAPLYLEHYLDQPVESVLRRATGESIERHEIVEAGNLASVSCRAACRLVATLPPLLLSERRRWIVFTATDVVRDLLSHLGAPLMELAPAQATSVPRGADWGHYYEHDPRVMAGYLPALS